MSGPVEQGRQRADVVRSEHHVHPWRPAQDGVAVLLGQTTTDSDLHIRIGLLTRSQVADIAVELVVGVLPNRAGVEHHDVGVGTVRSAPVAGGLQQTRKALRIMDVHLAAVGANLIGATGRRAGLVAGVSPGQHCCHGLMVRRSPGAGKPRDRQADCLPAG